MKKQAVGVHQLRLKFSGEQELVFHDLTLEIMEQEKVLIIGPSGSGKSTLLQVLSGIIPQYFPAPISFEKIVTPEQWGIVFQDPDTQFCMSYVDEELAFVLENRSIAPAQMEALMIEVLHKVGLKLPKLHIPIAHLSQGMKQRLALASILLLEPTTVFLDEPSALLDPEGKQQIWKSLRNTLVQHTVVVVEHHIDGILDWFDRVIVLNDKGEIVADSPPELIFQQQEPLLQQYGIWHTNSWSSFLTDAHTKAQLALRPNHCEQHDPIIVLENYIVHRGKLTAMHIDYAEIKRGSWIAITGENGAGKSSLLLALAKLLRSSGVYTLNGQSMQLKSRKIPEELSFVFQSPELQFVADTIFEELLLAYADKEPHKSYRKFVKQKKDNYKALIEQQLISFQLDLPLDRHPYQCSVGQKKRLSLLTAIANNRAVVLLDEPTFGQDATNTFNILQSLLALQQQGVTIIMITHDQMIASQFASEEWHLANGKLASITLPQGGTYGAQLAELART